MCAESRVQGSESKYDSVLKISTKHKSAFYYLNLLFCILLCIWVAWPYSNHVFGKYYTGIILSFIWFLTTDYNWMRKVSWDAIFLFIFFTTFIPYIVTGTFDRGEYMSILGVYYLSFIWIFINHYYMSYKKDYSSLGKIAFFSLMMYTVGSLQTYIGLLKYPMASRMLAGAVEKNPGLKNLYVSLGIGGFGYIYSACFVSVMALYLVIKEVPLITKNHKLICTISFASMLLMIIKASYVIALIITVTGIILATVVKNKKNLILLTILSLLFILISPKILIGELFLKAASIYSDNHIVHERFTDLANWFLNKSDATLTCNRLQLYIGSLKTFLNQPFFGIYGPLGDVSSSMVGGHSGWLDLLGYYGLFTSMPLFIGVYFNFRKQLKFSKSSNCYSPIFVLQILYLGLGLINPVLNIHEIGFAIFLLTPSMPFISYAFRSSKYRSLS